MEGFHQFVVIGAHDFDEDVVDAGGDDGVIDLGEFAERFGCAGDVAVDSHTNHGLVVEAQLHGRGHGDDLHDSRSGELRCALADSGF